MISKLPDDVKTAMGEVREISNPHKLREQPDLSVYMAVYNHQEFLDDAILGVLNQRNVSLELLIGEDCSSDQSLEIAKEYQHDYPETVRVITGDFNIGARLNFCRCMERARGRFIAFCEGDDWWFDEFKLARQMEQIKADQQMGGVHSDYHVAYQIDDAWKIVRRGWEFAPPSDPDFLTGSLFSRIFTRFPLRTCTVLYRREVIDGFLQSDLLSIDVSAGDRALAGYCAAHWNVGYMDLPTAIYRVTPGSATRQGNRANIDMYKGFVLLYERFKREYGHKKDFDHDFGKKCYAVLAIKAIRAGDKTEFARCMMELDRTCPRGKWKLAVYGLRALSRCPSVILAIVWLWDFRKRASYHCFMWAVKHFNYATVDVNSAPARPGVNRTSIERRGYR